MLDKDNIQRGVFMTLNEVGVGSSAVISAVHGEGALRRHLLDMGITPGTTVLLHKIAPMGDPIEIRLRGYNLTIRIDDAKKIEVVGNSNDFCTRR